MYEKVFEIMEKYDIECLFTQAEMTPLDTVKMLSDHAWLLTISPSASAHGCSHIVRQ